MPEWGSARCRLLLSKVQARFLRHGGAEAMMGVSSTVMMGAQTHHGARWQTSDLRVHARTPNVPCDPLSFSIGVPRQQTSAHAARQVRMTTTQSRQDGACTANALAQPSPKRVVRTCGAVATAWLFVHSAEKVMTHHDPRTQCRSMDSAQNTSVARRALEPSYCMVCARV